MSAAPTRPEDDGFDPAERIEQQSRALRALAEAGVELTRALVDEVAERREGPFRGVDPSLAFWRIGRAVRLAIALERRLREEPAETAVAARPDEAEDGDEAAAAGTEAAEPCERPESERPERERPDSERPDSERLREDLSDAALLSRPRAEVYALICRDLGASPEPGLFPDAACNDDDPGDATRDSAPDTPATACAAPPARRFSGGSGRAALLRSSAAAPMTWNAPILGPFRPLPP